MVDEFKTLFARDLSTLANEVNAFKNASGLWIIKPGVKNTAGNLCLHLVGNLRTYIGKNLGNVAYVRDRNAEFSLKHVPRDVVTSMITETKIIVAQSLESLKGEDLSHPYVEKVFDYDMTNGYFLAHLLAHLSYHLGQVNYLRRILEEEQ